MWSECGGGAEKWVPGFAGESGADLRGSTGRNDAGRRAPRLAACSLLR